MTAAEHQFILSVLLWVLVSIPVALLVFRVWFRDRPVRPVIPHEDAAPAGSFLDVALPPALPLPEETGLPVRQWKRIDGLVALALVVLLTVLMGPLATDPEASSGFEISAERMLVQLTFQMGMAGLLIFYLQAARGFDWTQLFGLRRHPWYKVAGYSIAWIIPGVFLVGIINYLTMPWLLEFLGQEMASPQLIVDALGKSTDNATKVVVFLSVGLGAPIMEELIFRGFLYPVGKRFMHWSYAAPASALFFAAVHGNAMSLIPLTVLGLIFTAAYERSKNLMVPIAMHAIFNLFQVSILFYAPHLAQPAG